MTLRLDQMLLTYRNSMPEEMPRVAAKGVLISVVTNLAFAHQLTTPAIFLGASLTALATVIEGLVRPIIESIFGQDNPSVGTIARTILCYSATYKLANLIGSWLGVAYRFHSPLLRCVMFALANSSRTPNQAYAFPL